MAMSGLAKETTLYATPASPCHLTTLNYFLRHLFLCGSMITFPDLLGIKFILNHCNVIIYIKCFLEV